MLRNLCLLGVFSAAVFGCRVPGAASRVAVSEAVSDTFCAAPILDGNPPADTPYIALGIFQYEHPIRELLSVFMTEISQKLGARVVEIRQFDKTNNGYGGHGDVSYTKQIDFALAAAINRSQGRYKIALFNLDEFDSTRFFPRWPPRYDDAWTAREVHLIMCNPCYRDRTRWYRNMRELTQQQLDAELGSYFPRICQVE